MRFTKPDYLKKEQQARCFDPTIELSSDIGGDAKADKLITLAKQKPLEKKRSKPQVFEVFHSVSIEI